MSYTYFFIKWIFPFFLFRSVGMGLLLWATLAAIPIHLFLMLNLIELLS